MSSYDVNDDGIVNVLDLIMVSQHFGQSVATLQGEIRDAATMLPLPGVNVDLDGNSALTDDGGNYVFVNVAPGTYPITFSKSGYAPITV